MNYKTLNFDRDPLKSIFDFIFIMAGNSFGTLFKLSSYGESHGEAIGGVIDGCPSGVVL